MASRYMPTRPSKTKCFVMLILTFAIYLIDNPLSAAVLGGKFFYNFVKPSLWLGLSLLICLLPNIRVRGLLRVRSTINWWAFNFAVICIVVSFLAGLIDGLGKSPYSHAPGAILINIFMVGSMVIGVEFIRSYLVNSLTERENYLIFIVLAFALAFIYLPVNKIFTLKGYKNVIIFTAEYFAPEFSKSLLATYLAFLGGPLPAIIFMGGIQGFYWLSPILPNLTWITTALVGILCPVFSLLIMQNIYLDETKKSKIYNNEQESPIGWFITCLSSIAIIWFAVGVFPIYPSVIATGSMEPMIKPGDVILVDKVKSLEEINLLSVGDVIQFKRDNILISHRIIQILEEDGLKFYRTKGDNNSAEDYEPVQPEQIKGVIIKVVPKIGWPTLLLKSNSDIPMDNIVF
ncbi:MAG: signal peptidase I [Peptococcales bacterium]|jgi:signal peptidase